MNNTLYSNGDDGISINTGDDNYIYNNTISSNTDNGIEIGDIDATNNLIKNNIISNHSGTGDIGISDSGTGTVIDYNYYYNNATDCSGTCSPNTLAAGSGNNPNFVSTDPANADFMYVNSTTTSNGPLGVGVELWAPTGVSATAPGYINVGARLDFVKNITDSEKFNWLQQAHDDSNLGAGDTVTTYAKNYFSDTITATSTTGNYYFKFNISSTANITNNNDYEGTYAYFTSGINKGKYYLIVDSTNASPDTLTIYSPTDAVTTFTPGDGFTVVDRVYTKDSGKSDTGGAAGSRNHNLVLTKDGSAGSPITWNTSGTVVVDAEHIRSYGIRGFYLNYNNIQRFVVEHTNIYGIYLSYSSNNTLSSNNSYSNSSVGIYVYNSSNNTLSSNNSYSNSSVGIYLDTSSNNNALFSNFIYANEHSNVPGIYIYDSDTNYLYHNTIAGNSGGGDGLRLTTTALNNIIRNNIIAYNAGYGIKDVDNGSEPTNSYNNLSSNSFGPSYQITEGAGTTTSDPLFYWEVATTTAADNGGTTQVLYDASQSWTENQWVGAGVYITGASCPAGNGVWAGVTSNTASRLFLAPTLSGVVNSSCNYGITWFYLSKNSPALAAGTNVVSGTQPSPAQINMGARLGYILNDNGAAADSKYNFLQQAEDDADYGAGDTLTVYGYEYATGTVSTTSDRGPYITVTTTESTIVATSSNYEGMYLFMTSGTNFEKSYLIIDTASTTPNAISIYTSSIDGFSNGDTFTIVDRLYNRQGTPTSTANLTLSTSGTATSSIIWDATGTAIITTDSNLDTQPDWDYNIYGSAGLEFVNFSRDFKLSYVQGSTASIYGTYTTTTYYYTFGGNYAPVAQTVSDTPDPLYIGSDITFTATWLEYNSEDQVKLYICKDSACTNCNTTSTANCYCYSSTWQQEPDTTDTCAYTTQTGDIGTQSYWLGVCDDDNQCDATPLSGGIFTVQSIPTTPPTTQGTTLLTPPYSTTGQGNINQQLGGTVIKTLDSGSFIKTFFLPQAVEGTIVVEIQPQDKETTIDLYPLPDNIQILSDLIVKLKALSGTQEISLFNKQAQITLSYTEQQLNQANLNETTLRLCYLHPSTNQWLPLPNQQLNTANNTLTAQTYSFYLVALAGEAEERMVPSEEGEVMVPGVVDRDLLIEQLKQRIIVIQQRIIEVLIQLIDLTKQRINQLKSQFP